MSNPEKCKQCKGTGNVTIDSPRGPVEVVCGICKGKGFVVTSEDKESEEILLLD